MPIAQSSRSSGVDCVIGLGPLGETLATVREESFDSAAMAAHGFAFEALDQLAMDHLCGVR